MRAVAALAFALLPFAASAQPISVELVLIGPTARQVADTTTRSANRPDMLPDGERSHGSGAIREAWLILPTARYAHGVIGDAIEAGGAAVRTSDDKLLSYTLGPDAVFEDRLARIMRIDGSDAVLSVKSYLDRGAALALLQVEGGTLRIAAESSPIGTAHRWLNPIGIADFDGDGRDEVAAILTPHIGGLLTLYRRDGAALRQVYQQGGFSNHAIGTRELGWSAIADFDGDGIVDIVTPDARRTRLRIVTFAKGRFAELASLPLPAALATSFTLGQAHGAPQPRVVFGLADGQTYALNVTRR